MTFVANSFLYRQVRNMVGCLVEVGKHGGRISLGDVKDLLLLANNNNNNDWRHGKREEASCSEGVVEDDRSGDDNNPSAIIKPAPSNRTKFKHRPYSTAPPQGLFLVDVQHGNFWF
jgi:tRNA U38,U39,U40 pseudouridine synthase TruA